MLARSWVALSTCRTSGAEVRSAACPDTINKPLQPIVGTSVRLCTQKPRSVSNFMQQRVGRSKIRFEMCTPPELVRAQFVSAARAVDGRRHEAEKTEASTEPRYM